MATVTPCQADPADTRPQIDTHANCSKVVVYSIVSSHITTVGIIPQVSRPEGVRTPDQCKHSSLVDSDIPLEQPGSPFKSSNRFVELGLVLHKTKRLINPDRVISKGVLCCFHYRSHPLKDCSNGY